MSARALYRALLRAAASLPTKNRRMMAEDKIRFEFRKAAGETDPDTLQELFLIGHTHLDTLGDRPAAPCPASGCVTPGFAPSSPLMALS